MADISNLGIYGLYQGAPPDGTSEKTFIILGSARGGTSMVASALKSLGVFIGDRLGVGNLEDAEMRSLWKSANWSAVADLVSRRNRDHRVWGVKFPAITRDLERVPSLFRNPCYLLIIRDPIAIAGRKIAARLTDVEQLIRLALHTHAIYRRTLRFVEQQKRPTLLVSYEKAYHDPAAFCRFVADFVGVRDSERIAFAISELKKDQKTYLARVSSDTARLESRRR